MVKAKRQKTYVMGMFPYPSGEGLHVGHVRIFTACDVMARYFRMKGQDVLSPMGWDAFGLPAENAAIKAKRNPIDMVPKNCANFQRQMQDLSLSFDWERSFATTDPRYYAITQWIFLQLYNTKDEHGKRLVYREKVAINWCPKCKTGLANEEVLPDGTHERCGTPVTKKLLPQWVMRITSYAEQLLAGLDEPQEGLGGKSLDWPRGILEMQRNWIGKKEGVVISHKVKDMDLTLETFSAYPAWLFADTFMVLAPDHPQVAELVRGTKYEAQVQQFVKECGEITEQQRLEDKYEKKGVFTGRYAMDPFNKGREMPVWVANFAMMGFGTGIIRCSAHDVRDYAFATKYTIPLSEVVERTDPKEPINAHDNTGILRDSGPFTGRSISPELIEEMVEWIVKEKIGKRETTYHLRDWVFSRQRYWGEPIPLVYCDTCGDENGVVPLTDKDLPLELPYLESYEPTDTGESPLSRVTDWVQTTCPKCGGPARRETDTMPNWAGSCWYFLAYPFWQAKLAGEKIDNLNDAKKYIKQWLPVDWYLGGAEHAVLHLLYARFWVKVLRDLHILDFSEPFLRLRSVGMVLAEDGKKMSKSLGNVVNPDDMIRQYGADATRLYEMFMGPWDQSIAWDSRAIPGQKRFLERIEATFADTAMFGKKSSPELALALSKLIGRVEHGILEQKFNTAIAGLMEFVNLWRAGHLVLSKEHAVMFVQLLSPFAPQVSTHLWQAIGGTNDVSESLWPILEGHEVGDVPTTIVVQVNGKVRGTVAVARSLSLVEAEVVKVAIADPTLAKWIPGKPKKTIFVPGKILSFVV